MLKGWKWVARQVGSVCPSGFAFLIFELRPEAMALKVLIFIRIYLSMKQTILRCAMAKWKALIKLTFDVINHSS